MELLQNLTTTTLNLLDDTAPKPPVESLELKSSTPNGAPVVDKPSASDSIKKKSKVKVCKPAVRRTSTRKVTKTLRLVDQSSVEKPPQLAKSQPKATDPKKNKKGKKERRISAASQARLNVLEMIKQNKAEESTDEEESSEDTEDPKKKATAEDPKKKATAEDPNNKETEKIPKKKTTVVVLKKKATAVVLKKKATAVVPQKKDNSGSSEEEGNSGWSEK